MSTGDTAWILISTALVMLMTPGLALFYGGMVRRKNILSTMMMSFAILALIGILWVLYGYSLAFGTDIGGIIGGLEWIGLRGVGQEPSSVYATTVPHLAFMMFQGMFAIITVALITGAVVERIRFSALLLFSVLWFTLVYCPVAHWVWVAVAGWRIWAPSISPVARWSTSLPACQPWPWPWCSVPAKDMRRDRLWSRATSPWWHWAQPCSGLAGSASTRAVP
jgi:ammonia channel protein AmtB